MFLFQPTLISPINTLLLLLLLTAKTSNVSLSFSLSKMEQNFPIIAKKVWNLMRVMFFMFKKGIISKSKIFINLNMMIKRGKIVGKALNNLLFHHHHNWATSTFSIPPLTEYEFSCTTTPQSLFSTHKKQQNKHYKRYTPNAPRGIDDKDEIMINATVIRALEMLTSATASPGFGKSPMVKQLRITDSPFPLSGREDEDEDEDGNLVDEAADKFIMRFYNDLRRQN